MQMKLTLKRLQIHWYHIAIRLLNSAFAFTSWCSSNAIVMYCNFFDNIFNNWWYTSFLRKSCVLIIKRVLLRCHLLINSWEWESVKERAPVFMSSALTQLLITLFFIDALLKKFNHSITLPVFRIFLYTHKSWFQDINQPLIKIIICYFSIIVYHELIFNEKRSWHYKESSLK